MGFADEFPLFDIGAVDAGTNYVVEAGSGLLEGGFDIEDDLFGLGINIAEPTSSPAVLEAVVPETWMVLPILTARE